MKLDTFWAVAIVSTAILSGCSKSPGPTGLASGLVANWPSEASANDHPAALVGGVHVVDGSRGKAYSFDTATGRVVIPDASALNFGAGRDFSIAAWVRPEHEETSFGVMPIVDKRQVNGIVGALGYALCLEYGKLSFQLAPAARTPLKFSDLLSPAQVKTWWQQRKLPPTMAFARYVSPEPDLRDGELHHVAVTVERRSKTGGKLYVDGRAVLTFDPTGQISSLANREPFLIGGHPDPSLNCPYKGMIEDVRLYSRALSSAEITELCSLARN